MKQFLLFLSLLFPLSLSAMQAREWSLVDQCDVEDDSFPGLAETDTLQLFLEQQKEELTAEVCKEQLPPLLGQVTSRCNNNQVEPPFIYAAKKGMHWFIEYVLEKTDTVVPQALLDQALHGAVLYSHTELAQYLLDKNANPQGYFKEFKHPYTTLDVAFMSFGIQKKELDPPVSLIRSLIHLGAQGEVLYGSAIWFDYVKKFPDIRVRYMHLLMFGPGIPTLQQLCIAYYADTANFDYLELQEARRLPGLRVAIHSANNTFADNNMCHIPQETIAVPDDVLEKARQDNPKLYNQLLEYIDRLKN